MIIYSSGKKDAEKTAQEAPEQVSTMFVENRQTQTFGWVLKAAKRSNISPELTLQDRRELAGNNPPLTNAVLNVKAKRIYAAGGKTRDIQRECKISPDYAAKLHAAFGRANKPAKTCNRKKQF